MKVFIRKHRLPPLATFVLLAVLVAVSLGDLGRYALASGTWTSQISSTSQNLKGIACLNASTCFAVGAGGTIVATTNGGITSWTNQSSVTITNDLNGIACPSTTICYVVGATSGGGTAGAILKTTDGSSWSTQNGKVKQNYNGVACLSTLICYIVGASGTILNTTNGGSGGSTPWTSQTVGAANLNGIACPATNTCFAVGAGGTILKTIDGSTWTPQTSNTTNSLNGIACLSTTSCFAVGAASGGGNATILSYNGTTWTPQTSGTTNSLNGIACLSASTCFAAGNSGTILTNNAGSLTESGGIATTATPVTLNGANHTTTYTLGVTVSDTTGSGNGWNLTITSTTFTTGTHTLSTTASTITAPTAACVGACTRPTVTGITYPFTIPAGSPIPTALKYFNAAATSGMGTMTVTATVTVAIPANTFHGVYTSTLTIAIVSGPS